MKIGKTHRFDKFFKRKSEKNDRARIVREFIDEIARYKLKLDEAIEKNLGEDIAEKVDKLSNYLLPEDSFIYEARELEKFMLGGFSKKENLLFYVGIDWGENAQCDIDHQGFIKNRSKTINTLPLVFLNTDVLKNSVKEFKQSLPGYFTPWLHEYCHFILP